MTNEELAEEIQKAYERAEANWCSSDYGIQVSTTVFYLSALSAVKKTPFEEPVIQKLVLEFLESRLDKAFGKLSSEEYEQVFQMTEEIRQV